MITKIRFEFYNEILEREDVETLWAESVDEEKGYYKLANIPFFVKGFAASDIVKAHKVDKGLPKVIELVEASGNSTINVIFFDNQDKEYPEKILKSLQRLGAEYEEIGEMITGYYTLNIPADKPYRAIHNFLMQESDKLDFREACMGHK